MWELLRLRHAGRQARQHAPEAGNESQAGRLRLDDTSLCRVGGNVRGARLVGRHGRLWVTQTGNDRDVILRPGEIFVAETGGEIVVQSIPSAAEVSLADLFADAARCGVTDFEVLRGQKTSLCRLNTSEFARTDAWESRAYLALSIGSALALAIAFW